MLRLAAIHGLMSVGEVERWFAYRDNRNSTAHDYGEGFAKETLALLPGFVADAKTLEAAPRAKFSDLDLVLRNPQNLLEEADALSDLKEAFTESNLPIRVDIMDWARIPVSFHREIEREHVVVQEG